MSTITTPTQSPKEVASLFDQARSQWPPGQSWPYLDMGREFALGLDVAPELPLESLAGMAIERGTSDPPFAARALYCIAMINRRHRRPDQALPPLLQSLGVAEKVSSLAIVRDVLLQLSRVYEELGEANEALAAYKRFSELRLRSLLPADPEQPTPVSPTEKHDAPPSRPASQIFRDLEPGYLRKALHFIDQGVGKPLSVADVVAHCGVSRRTLEMAFRKHRLESLNRYIKRLQLEFAADRLRLTSVMAQEVGELIGYRSPTTFAREFRKQFGQAPAAWRRASS